MIFEFKKENKNIIDEKITNRNNKNHAQMLKDSFEVLDEMNKADNEILLEEINNYLSRTQRA